MLSLFFECLWRASVERMAVFLGRGDTRAKIATEIRYDGFLRWRNRISRS